MKRIALLLFIVTISFADVNAQKWEEMMQDPSISFYEVQQEFNTYFEGRERIKGDGYNVFKRWEHWMERHIDAEGFLPPAGTKQKEYTKFMTQYRATKKKGGDYTVSEEGNWSSLGSNTTLENWTNFDIGIGRVDQLIMDPFDSNTFYACTPAGGLWKSTDACASWNITGTDSLLTMGIGHIAFHPLEQDHLFATTGDRDALGTRSIGLIESYDGGDTWDTTGLSYNLYDFKRIYRVLIHPTQPDTMYVATLEGIVK
ncbi:MAG TPA: hypothetical protein EYN69_12775 [Flavobacteriales bacterium]|nr:hypothetical protein [Flavobacteriales bacterium]